MGDYHERLRVPIGWWLITAICVLVLGTELFAGYRLAVGIGVYTVLAVVCGGTLLHWGSAVVEVTGGELRAGRERPPRQAGRAWLPRRPAPARLPLTAAGQVRPLDEAQTRAMRGPHADPAAHVLIRPYLKESVYIAVIGEDPAAPYWLICTRRATALAAAIEKSREALLTSDEPRQPRPA